MKSIKNKLLNSTLVATFISLALSSAQSFAVGIPNGPVRDGTEAAKGTGVPDKILGQSSTITNFINILLFIVGGLAVIMIILGGLRYVISGGDSKKVEGAKNTILYAIVGLIIAMLAYAIVNFVLGAVTVGGDGGTEL